MPKKNPPKSEYSKLLLDPRWQRKRLEILQRDDFACLSCENSQETLHVHHCYYDRESMPWEYPDSSLITLCKLCHDDETKNDYIEKKLLSRIMGVKGFLSQQVHELACAFYNAEIPPHDSAFIESLCWLIENSDNRKILLKKYQIHLKNKALRMNNDKIN